jgi:glutathione S-transferase
MSQINKVRVIGSYLSPYVRKVLVCLAIKGIPYEIDPIVPFYGNEEFSKLSPLRRIPVFTDDKVTLCDSSVICQYLEDCYPSPNFISIYPNDIVNRAKARWYEEYADTYMGNIFIWQYYNEVMINPFVWKKKSDQTIIDRSLNIEIPKVLQYLEENVPKEGYMFGENHLTIADISITCFFRNLFMAKAKLNVERYPLTFSYINRILSLSYFELLNPFEKLSLVTPILNHRTALAKINAPINDQTFGVDKPIPGALPN